MTDIFFDAGPQGAAVTTTNQPGLSQVTTGAVTFDTAMGLRGGFGALFTSQPGQPAIARMASNTASNTQAFSGVCHMPDTGTVSMTLMTFRHASGVAMRILKTTEGRLTVSDSANTITPLAAVGTISAGTKYRIEARVVGGSTTAGRIRIAVYTATGTTPLATPVDITNANLTANMITGGDLGDTQNGAAVARSMGWEDVRIEADRTTEFGPYTPPVVVTPQTTAVPISQSADASGWTGSFTDIADASDATFVESPAAPVTDASSPWYKLGPVVVPSTFSLSIRHLATTSGTSTGKVRLRQGTSALKKEWTVTPPTTIRTDVLTLSSAETATITDWTDLYVSFSYTGS